MSILWRKRRSPPSSGKDCIRVYNVMYKSEQTRLSVLKVAILKRFLARPTDSYNYLVFTNSLYVVGELRYHAAQKANRVSYIIMYSV